MASLRLLRLARMRCVSRSIERLVFAIEDATQRAERVVLVATRLAGGKFAARGADMLMAFPTLLLALAVVATLGGSIRNLILAVTLAYIPVFSRVVRGSALSVKQNDFVEASRALGATTMAAHHV